MSATLELARPQPEAFTQIQFPRELSKCLLAYQPGAHPAQLTFFSFRKVFIQHRGDDEVNDTVTKKLEPLVIAGTRAAVGQRIFQIVRLVKPVRQIGQTRRVHQQTIEIPPSEYDTRLRLNNGRRKNGVYTQYMSILNRYSTTYRVT